jgi:hypothetical protein
MALAGYIAAKLKNWDDRRHPSRTDEFDQRVAALASSTITQAANRVEPALDDVITKAWTMGQDIELSGIGYGPAHWGDGERFVSTPYPYYRFLAGLVRSRRCHRIFEIGSHYGGSILSMMRGIDELDQDKILTVDITDLNPALHSVTGLQKIIGDANTEGIIQKAVTYFEGKPIDMMYIDADHSFLSTIENISVYGILLRPAIVVLDDIVLNESMRAMWNVIRAAYGAEAVNCVDVIPEIRSSAVGFGLLRLR